MSKLSEEKTTIIGNDTFVRTNQQLNWAGLIAGQVGVAACFEGDPGVGKSATFECLAEATGRKFLPYYLQSQYPEDLTGYPDVKQVDIEGLMYRCMEFVPDERMFWGMMVPSLFLIEEVTNARGPKQAAALKVVQEGLAQAWMYLACNDPAVAADGAPLTQPFINRIWYGKWQTDVEAQDYGFTHNLQFPQPSIPIIGKEYVNHLPDWGARVQRFLSHNPQLRNACPRKRGEAGKPFPSSRSWDNAIRVLSACESCGATDEVKIEVGCGLLGEGTAASFFAYLASLQLPSPEAMMKDPQLIVNLSPTYDAAILIGQGCLAYAKTHYSSEAVEQVKAVARALGSVSPEIQLAVEAGIDSYLSVDVAALDV